MQLIFNIVLCRASFDIVIADKTAIESIDWTEDKEDHEDKDLWLEDWDNEDFDDDFTKQLRYVADHELDNLYLLSSS